LSDLVISSQRVASGGRIAPASVVIEGGRIAAVEPGLGGTDFGDLMIMAGLVDSHVHVNEPGRTHWEGFATATMAAAAGGVTTIVDMPLNSIPATTSSTALAVKRNAAAGNIHVDVAFWGGIVPGNEGELPGLVDAGVVGFKAFLVDSGVPDFPAVTLEELEAAAAVVGSRPVLVHAELPSVPVRSEASSPRMGHDAYVASRPDEDEIRAVDAIIDIAGRTGTPMHVVHLSAAGSLPLLAAAKAAGVPITAETCPHYLAFCMDDVADDAVEIKCAPPIRDHDNREALWSGLDAGVIDMVVSDHSPSPPEMKDPVARDFATAWGGIGSLELRLAITWTGATQRDHPLSRLERWLCTAPARLCGLDDRGSLAVGAAADLVVWDPDTWFEVDPARLRQRHPLTPYAGRRLRGVVRQTLLRGDVIFEDGAGGPPTGRLVART
jgi:allantoinase